MKNINKIKIRWLLLFMIISVSTHSFGQGIRKHYEEMTNDERDALVAAYWALGGETGELGLNANMAAFHEVNFDEIHFNTEPLDVFLAWHRQASVELQRAMKDDADNEWITIAYWDWTLSNDDDDLLWNDDWLGPFNDPWELNRQFDFNWNNPHLPNQSHIDFALTEADFFTFSDLRVERNLIHAGAHVWLGGRPPNQFTPPPGVMANRNSPKDPAFFFHHNMVDKVWADWYEIHHEPGNDYYIMTSMSRYPDVDPDDIADPRSLGIFYAENGLAVLDKYMVSNTSTPSEKFGYQFSIEAKDEFIIPSGKDAELRSCNEVLLLPGFFAQGGSTFEAGIDQDCDFSTALKGSDGKGNKKYLTEQASLKNEGRDLVTEETAFKIYPNPFSNYATIEYTLDEDSEISIALLDITGKVVKILLKNSIQPADTHQINLDAKNLSNGIYYCRLRTGKTSQIIKLVLNR